MQHFKDLKFINLRGQDKLPIIHGVYRKKILNPIQLGRGLLSEAQHMNVTQS